MNDAGAWRKASYSNGTGSCVEVGNGARAVKIRDTKEEHMGDGRTVLSVTPGAWQNFTRSFR